MGFLALLKNIVLKTVKTSEFVFSLACLIAVLVQTVRTAPTACAEDTPVSLEEAREQGRARSRFLTGAKTSTSTADVAPTANVAFFEKSVRSILAKSCLDCHGPDDTQGGVRVDQLDPNLLSGSSVDKWREIYNVLSNSEMPPEGESDYALDDSDRGKIVDWLSEELMKASKNRRNDQPHSSFRRLTKYEYNYALQDLLGLPYQLASKLPPETASEDGFKNSSELLQMSARQFETYREIGLQALRRATVHGERPEPVTYVISMKDEIERAKAASKAKVFHRDDDSYAKDSRRQHLLNRESGEAVHFASGSWQPDPNANVGEFPDVSTVALALPRSNELKMNLDRFLPDDGIMRVRIRAGRSTMNADEYASLRLIFSAHTSNNANFMNVISERDKPVTASAEHPEYIDFHIPLSDIQRNPFRKLATKFPRRDEFLHIRNIANSSGREQPFHVLIDQIEITAPYYEQWPPKTHTEIFFDSEFRQDETKYGRAVLARFLRRIWRRPAEEQELDRFVGLFEEYRRELPSFEDAMVEVLATALATPEFLYLTQRTPNRDSESHGAIRDFELASRLALFLWSSLPDEELLQLAEQEKLHDPKTLSAQVDRMLVDRRADRFSMHFVQQWLGLDGLDSVAHVKDSDLKAAMQQEPIAFFDEVLQHNRSIMDFIHSDYVMVNERLAKHFGLRNVSGPHFRKVSVDPQQNRGGLLTSAAVLTMNSDGKDSHPLKRGVWMLERILHDPPPPPPPNVPEVDLTDPKILRMTLKERIADHRNKAACRSCHSRIDPWGIAFENYDALGAFRTQVNNKPVDATAELFGRQKLAGMDGLKRHLLKGRQDQFAYAMVHKLTAYALGRPLAFGDYAELESLTAEFRNRGDRLNELVHLIIGSDLFRSY